MANKHEFTLPCIPVGQQRARHGTAKNGKPVTFKSPEQVVRERELEQLLLPYKPDVPVTRPVAMYVKAYMPIPKSASAKFRKECENPLPPPHAKKPDVDNLAKFLLDAMSRVGFWLDDAQVAVLCITKAYSAEPRWHVILV